MNVIFVDEVLDCVCVECCFEMVGVMGLIVVFFGGFDYVLVEGGKGFLGGEW